MRVRFYTDDFGYAGCELPQEFKLLESYLTSDIQGALSAKATLAYIEKHRNVVESQLFEPFQGGCNGNAFTLLIWPEGAEVSFNYREDISSPTVNVDFLKELIEYWAEFKASKETELIFITQHNP